MTHFLEMNFRGMDLSQFILWFFIYSFLGWAMECVVIRKQLGYWENRGFAKMPFCVIYGFGTYIAFSLFGPIENNYPALFVLGAIAATAFEYLTAIVMKKLFGEVWWNYDHLRFNYKGIICLQSTIGWGCVALIVFGFLNDYIVAFVTSIDSRIVALVSMILLISYFCDFTYHFFKNLEKSQSFDAIYEKASNITHFFHR